LLIANDERVEATRVHNLASDKQPIAGGCSAETRSVGWPIYVGSITNARQSGA
jgi:hypothetical protein